VKAPTRSLRQLRLDKESNASENDWTDLMNLTFALDPDTTPASSMFVPCAQPHVDVWLRHFAVLFLMNYTETAWPTGPTMITTYRGLIDPRFLLLPRTILTPSSAAPNSTPDDIFLARRFPTSPAFCTTRSSSRCFMPNTEATGRRLLD
jgi:hypothetical protein